MKTSKTEELIRALEPAEIPVFRHLLSAGKGNNDKKLLRLFDLVSSKVRRYPEERADKKILFQNVFPGKRYNDQQFRYLTSDLAARLGQFLVRRGLEKDNAVYHRLLVRELATRRAVKAYTTRHLAFEKEKKSAGIRDISYYQHCYESGLIHLMHATAGMKRDEKSNIADVVDYLDRFYLARKLQLCCEIFNVRNVLSVKHNVFLLDEILVHLKNRSYEDTPVIRIYYQILMTLLESENENHFHDLRLLLERHINNFSLRELREMYQYLLNYCIKKINLGDIGWQKTLFDIYRITLTNDVLLSEGHLPQYDYKNIVTIGLRLKEYTWTKKFIGDFRKHILPADRENAFVYNSANLAFNTGDYSRARKLLQQVEFTDLYYQLDAKSILLKTYFELDETESFFYHAAAFRTFLKRNRLVSDYQRSIYLNLIRYASQLLRAAGNKRKTGLIKKKVETNRNIADLQWLLAKLEERR